MSINAENAWIEWLLYAPEAAQVALDMAVEALAIDPDHPGLNWAKCATGPAGVPPPVAALAAPGVSWEELLEAGGNLENTGKRRYIRLDADEVLELVKVPGGTFFIGAPAHADHIDRERNPLRQVTLPHDYFIGRFLVTNAQYRCFTKATRYPPPSFAGTGSLNGLRQPIVGITSRDARAFCTWLAEKSGFLVRLPNGREWERAARGEDSRAYPWGNERPNEQDPDYRYPWPIPEVGQSPEKISPYGVEDLVGTTQQICTIVEGDAFWPENTYNFLRETALYGNFAPVRNDHYAWLVHPWSGQPSRFVGFRVACTG